MMENMSTDFPKDSENILGEMVVISKETSNRAIEMDMEFGMMLLQVVKTIKATICLIKNMAMEFMTGEMAISTKEISFKTNEMVKGNSTITNSLLMMVIGTMDKELIKINSKLSKAI